MQSSKPDSNQNEADDQPLTTVSAPSSNLKAFPKRQPSLQSNLDKSTTVFPVVSILSPTELSKEIKKRTRLSFAELLLTILEVDFCGSDDNFNEFKKVTQKLIFKTFELKPEDEKLLFDKVSGNNDLAAAIITIKNDEYVKKNSPVILLACFLNVVLGGGCYDSRHRVLIRHCTALMGIVFDEVEQVEDTLTDCLMSEFEETDKTEKDAGLVSRCCG